MTSNSLENSFDNTMKSLLYDNIDEQKNGIS